jgi:transposase InsO family protein
VSDNIPEIMLGVDWLKKHNAVWRTSQGEVTLDGCNYKLSSHKPKGWIRRVVLPKEEVIPARCQRDIRTRVEYNDISERLDDDLTTWITEPTEPGYGVYVARTAVSAKNHSVPVRVLNVTEYPVTLKRGTMLSDLMPVEPVESDQLVATVNETDAFAHLEGLTEKADESIDDQQREELRKMLEKYADVFSKGEYDLGCTSIVEHNIDTGSNRPIKQAQRRHPPLHMDAILEQTQEMMGQGVVEPACSEWRSNVVLVKKKDNTLRFCIDYRQLNDVTRKDTYPLPRIDTCLDTLSGSNWFSSFDLRSGYHQVLVSESDRDKTTFVTRDGTFRFRCMPFGLCNAGATFQRLMDIVMRGLNFEICLVYLDDILLYSRSIPEHLTRLEVLLQRLREANLKLKPSKCHLLQKQVHFLGHVVSGEGIGTDSTKTDAVATWPVPKTVREVRSFLGLASYYRRFVKNFAEIASPLHDLTKKNKPFHWTEICQIAFDRLKTVLTEAPVMAMPIEGQPYFLDTDASHHGIGAVLSQIQDGKEKPVAFASRTYNRAESNYCITRQELLAVVFFLKHFRQYLLGSSFTVRTDHSTLQWPRRTPEPIGQQGRWLEIMESYQFKVEHRPGARHNNADALSRRPCGRPGCSGIPEVPVTQHVENDVRANDSIPVTSTINGNESLTRELSYDNGNGVCSIKAPAWCRNPTGTWSSVKEKVEPSEPDLGVQNKTTAAAVFTRLQAQRAVEGLTTLEEEDDRKDLEGRNPQNQSRKDAPSSKTEAQEAIQWSWEDIIHAQKNDPELRKIYDLKMSQQEKPSWNEIGGENGKVKAYWHQWDRLQLRNDVLCRRWETLDGLRIEWQVVYPQVYRSELIRKLHAGITGGHMGLAKTCSQLQSRAYWVGWNEDVKAELQKCVPCSQYYRMKPPRQARMQQTLVGEQWERVGIDITGKYPRSLKGNEYILTLVDHFSKWAEAFAIPNHRAPTVAKVLFEQVFTRFGTPKQILSDLGSEFSGHLMTELCRCMEIDKIKTTAYRPQTNGICERFHRTLNSMLAKLVREDQRDWDTRLPFVMAAYRATIHDSTGFSPNFMIMAREVSTPLDIMMGAPETEIDKWDSIDDFVANRQEMMRSAYCLARQNLKKAAQRRKNYYDIRVREQLFKPGDWVYYYYPRRYTRKSPKWMRCYTGPYAVIRTIPPSNVVIQRSKRSKSMVVHVDKLKRCLGAVPASWTLSDDTRKEKVDFSSEYDGDGLDEDSETLVNLYEEESAKPTASCRKTVLDTVERRAVGRFDAGCIEDSAV